MSSDPATVQPPSPTAEQPPTTGQAEVDAALAAVADLEQAPLSEHADRLARAHETLHTRLQGDRPA